MKDMAEEIVATPPVEEAEPATGQPRTQGGNGKNARTSSARLGKNKFDHIKVRFFGNIMYIFRITGEPRKEGTIL